MLGKIFFYFLKTIKMSFFFIKLNVWIFLNIQLFIKTLSNKLVYFIEALSTFKLNLIDLNWKTFSFESIYVFHSYCIYLYLFFIIFF